MRLSAVEELPKDRWNLHQQRLQSEESSPPEKMTTHRHIAEVATLQRFCQGVFTRPRPIADVQAAAR